MPRSCAMLAAQNKQGDDTSESGAAVMRGNPISPAKVTGRFGVGIAFFVVAFAVGCGGGGGGGNGGTTNPPPPASGGFILGASSTSISIAKNATASATGSLT